MKTNIKSTPATDSLNGALRRYRNINTRAWLFGFAKAKWEPSGLKSLWTADESLALADNGAVAATLGLESEGVSFDMRNTSGGSGSGFTRWDLMLEQVPGGDHASSMLVQSGPTLPGFMVQFTRDDAATITQAR